MEKGFGVNKIMFINLMFFRVVCFDGYIEIVKFLVEYKVDIEIVNRYGYMCLMIFCYKGYKDIVKFFLEFGVDVNRKSVKGDYCVIKWIDEKMFFLWDIIKYVWLCLLVILMFVLCFIRNLIILIWLLK